MAVRWLTAFIDRPPSTFDDSLAFWLQVTGSTLSPWRGSSQQFATLVPGAGDAYLRVQRVQDGPGGSHLAVHVDDIDASSAQAVSLGASVTTVCDDDVVHRSPAGYTFCIVGHAGERTVAPPSTAAAGTRTLVDQLCIGIPPNRFDEECGFWSALTGWALRDGRLAEFRYLERPDHVPFRILLQRLDDEPAHTDAHLDLSCSDVDTVASDHVALGATRVSEHPLWTTLADPSGRPYCLLRRDPITRR